MLIAIALGSATMLFLPVMKTPAAASRQTQQ